MKAAIIPADATQPIRIEAISVDLDTLQGLVGGMIESVGLRAAGVNMYLNEEGKILGLPLNYRASRIAHQAAAIHSYDLICGDVVMLGPIDGAGNDTSLSTEDIAWITGTEGADGHPERAGQR